MKTLLLIFITCVSLNSIPQDYGHTVVSYENCRCADTFKNTVKWSKGKRGGFYCIATSRKGNEYKRYFSQWLKQKSNQRN